MQQPNSPSYPAADLELFPRLSRGVSDPPFNVTRRPKDWLDPSATSLPPDQFIGYKVFHDLSGVEVAIYMPAGEAATTNFPDPMPALPPVVPAWDRPVRDLLPNEKVVPFPLGLLVVRTDLGSTPTNWTQTDEQILLRIAAKLGV